MGKEEGAGQNDYRLKHLRDIEQQECINICGMHTQTCAPTHTSSHEHAQLRTYIQIQSHKLKHTHTHVISHTRTCTHTHIHTHTHTTHTNTHTHTHINTSKTKKRIPHSCTHVKSHALLVAGASNSVTIQAVDLVAFKGFLQIRSHFPTQMAGKL